MFVQITRSEQSVALTEIKAVEAKLGFSFPEQYQKFLLTHNGGRPTPDVFRFVREGSSYSESMVDWFLAIHTRDFNDFETYFDIYKIDQVRLPTELVPIASDPGGNLICISVNGENLGAVYFWDHDIEEDPPSYANVRLIANSFDEFLGALFAG